MFQVEDRELKNKVKYISEKILKVDSFSQCEKFSVKLELCLNDNAFGNTAA